MYIFFFRYSKLEYDHARSLWIAGVRHIGDIEATEADYETQFSMMVEQEVEKREVGKSFKSRVGISRTRSLKNGKRTRNGNFKTSI